MKADRSGLRPSPAPGSNPAPQLVSSNSDRKEMSPSMLPASPAYLAFSYRDVVAQAVPRHPPQPLLTSRSCASMEMPPPPGRQAAASKSIPIARSMSFSPPPSPPPPASSEQGTRAASAMELSPTLSAQALPSGHTAWSDMEDLRHQIRDFGVVHAMAEGNPSPGAYRTLLAYANLGGPGWLSGLGTLSREHMDSEAVQLLVNRLAFQALQMGGALMPVASFYRFCHVWREGLLAIASLRHGPAALERCGLGQMVLAFGAQEAPADLLFALLDQTRLTPGLEPRLVRRIALGLLAARFQQGPGEALDHALLDWLRDDLSARTPALVPTGGALADRSTPLLQGSMDAYLRATGDPLARLHGALDYVMTDPQGLPAGPLVRFLGAAIDSCGLALPAQTAPLARMRQVTLALLQAWSEGEEPAPYRMLCHVIDGLGDRQAISWMAACEEPWDTKSARRMVGRSIRDLPRPAQRLAVSQALEWLEQPLIPTTPVSAASPAAPEQTRGTGEPASAPVPGTRAAKRKNAKDPSAQE